MAWTSDARLYKPADLAKMTPRMNATKMSTTLSGAVFWLAMSWMACTAFVGTDADCELLFLVSATGAGVATV
jgi:hypothetical protein